MKIVGKIEEEDKGTVAKGRNEQDKMDKLGRMRFRKPVTILAIRLGGIIKATSEKGPPQMSGTPENRTLVTMSDYWALLREVGERKVLIPDMAAQLFVETCKMAGLLEGPTDGDV